MQTEQPRRSQEPKDKKGRNDMKLRTRIHRRRLRHITLVLVAAAIVAPSAQAVGVPSQPFPTMDNGVPSAIPTDGPRAGGVPETQLRISTDGPRSGPSAAQLHEVIADTYTTDAPRSGPATVDLPQAEPLTGPSGFDWLDAGVGIAIGIAASLVLVAVVLLVSRRRERIPAF